MGSSGTAGTAGTLGSGGVTATSGGATRSGGANQTGGVAGSGGRPGVSGAAGVATGAGGLAGTGGGTSLGGFGMACTTTQDCTSGSTCCNGSSESCDGTVLPKGDGTDSEELVVSADGSMVTDTITGLVWQADGSGARPACTTDTTHLTCTQVEAQTYCSGLSLNGLSDWRVPAEHELRSILDLAQGNPAVDLTVFPSTTAAYYWTSSPYVLPFLSSGNAWYVDFAIGFSFMADAGTLNKVRCVRGSRCYPTSRFLASGGLVTDTLTKLVWQEETSTPDITQTDAPAYCSAAGPGFRLPTLKELDSLVDFTATTPPSINQTAFPNTPVGLCWTSSPYVLSSGDAWASCSATAARAAAL